jgi:cytochrome b6-f complex iron-sulfur subunit
LFPRVIYEPPAVFKAGYPEEYPPGSVSTKWQPEFRTVLVRRETGEFYALFMKCTHLGCTPVWLGPENKFKCPCHGSGFTRDGNNYEGPAPRALERFEVTVADDGQILVNRAKKFLYESGEWENSYLTV